MTPKDAAQAAPPALLYALTGVSLSIELKVNNEKVKTAKVK
jgi:hypothetical protein